MGQGPVNYVLVRANQLQAWGCFSTSESPISADIYKNGDILVWPYASLSTICSIQYIFIGPITEKKLVKQQIFR